MSAALESGHRWLADEGCARCDERFAASLLEAGASDNVVLAASNINKAALARLKRRGGADLCNNCPEAMARLLARDGARINLIRDMTNLTQNQAKSIRRENSPVGERSAGQVPISERYYLESPTRRAHLGLAATAYIKFTKTPKLKGLQQDRKQALLAYLFYRSGASQGVVSFDLFYGMTRLLHANILIPVLCDHCGTFHIAEGPIRMQTISCPFEDDPDVLNGRVVVRSATLRKTSILPTKQHASRLTAKAPSHRLQ